ncbi:helix-turn-helix domain-containing protein [Leptospira kmetyi]|uniref:helix-turn-helix domain-containing protein n=1 Tax=Leptospira kmetyi TaxID=408139 RepID=UPI001082631C|nr:helix-turn-helix domain-containing protein [Leptospira kmetyi]TGK23374.1 helix-turn-helix domain-containing protein [Leptospira kmetyi]TGK34408.1 helix-turn-helix domain-containing protein [Leptospira kmetyi]
MENLNDLIAQTIKRLRESSLGGKGISQTELAKYLKTTPNTISRWETGEYKPKIQDLYEMAKFFQVSVLTFFPSDETSTNTRNEAVQFRGSSDLDPKERDEIQNFIDFRLAQKKLLASEKKTSGRKRKHAAE